MMNAITAQIIDGPLGGGDGMGDAPGAGAIIRFDGVVRPSEDDAAIAALDYEVYSPMAEQQLRRLAEEAMAAHAGVLAIAVQHSRGRVPAGGCSFRLWVASRHRAEGLAAMGSFIDRMKQDVPIWKTPVPADETGGDQ